MVTRGRLGVPVGSPDDGQLPNPSMLPLLMRAGYATDESASTAAVKKHLPQTLVNNEPCWSTMKPADDLKPAQRTILCIPP